MSTTNPSFVPCYRHESTEPVRAEYVATLDAMAPLFPHSIRTTFEQRHAAASVVALRMIREHFQGEFNLKVLPVRESVYGIFSYVKSCAGIIGWPEEGGTKIPTPSAEQLFCMLEEAKVWECRIPS